MPKYATSIAPELANRKKRANTNLFLLTFAFALVVSFPFRQSLAKPQLSKAFRPQWFETLVSYENYFSVSNYSSSGHSVALPSSGSFWSSSGFDFSSRYAFSYRLAATAGLNYITAQASQANVTRFNGGMQTLKGGVEYKIPTSYADFVAEGVVHASLYQPNENSTRPLYGDGAQVIGGHFWMLQRVGQLFWHGRAGLLFRSDGLSSLLPYQLGLHWRPGSWTFSSILEGSWSLLSDTAGDTQRNNYLRRSNVGSMIYRSANPITHSLDLQIKYDITQQFGFLGGMGMSLWGRNSSEGSRYFFAMDIHWPPVSIITNKNPLKNTLPSKSSGHDEESEEKRDQTPLSL